MAGYQITVYKSVKKYLAKNKLLKDAFDAWIPHLSTNPHTSHDGMVINQYFDGRQVYKKRLLGPKYRALFTINDEAVIVDIFEIGSRGGIYKK